jgi:hypothetical protein
MWFSTTNISHYFYLFLRNGLRLDEGPAQHMVQMVSVKLARFYRA